MRNLNRIARISELIIRIWKKHPGLRLCQLIGNCFEPGDNYHKEDDELEKKLIELYGKNGEKIRYRKNEKEMRY